MVIFKNFYRRIFGLICSLAFHTKTAGSMRVLYVISLVGAMLFVALYSRWFSWYLFIVLLALLPLDLLISLPGIFGRKLEFSAPAIPTQNSRAILAITTICEKPKKPFPARCIKIDIVNNFFDTRSSYRVKLGAFHESTLELELDTSLCGVTSYSVGRMWIVSVLGLFSVPRPVDYSVSMLIIPPPIKPTREIILPDISIMRPKPGGGFADEHDLRKYRAGDSIRSIHWKVSAKLNSLVIREPLAPRAHSRLICFSTWQNAQEAELILGRLFWTSTYLLKKELPYYILHGNSGTLVEITNNDQLMKYLYSIFCKPIRINSSHIEKNQIFSWEYVIDAS